MSNRTIKKTDSNNIVICRTAKGAKQYDLIFNDISKELTIKVKENHKSEKIKFNTGNNQLKYLGDFVANHIYEKNNMVRFIKNNVQSVYIYIGDNVDGPYREGVDITLLPNWKLILTEKQEQSIKFCGDWENTKYYFTNNIVRYMNATYLAINNSSRIVPTDVKFWALICNDGTQIETKSNNLTTAPEIIVTDIISKSVSTKKKSIENNDKHKLKNKKYTHDIALNAKSVADVKMNELAYYNNINICEEYGDTIHNKRITSIFEDVGFDILHEDKIYYSVKKYDTTYQIDTSEKCNVPIIFDKTIRSDTKYSSKNNQIFFSSIGTYKITINIKFTGIKYYKMISYLLLPSDNILSGAYPYDRKIKSSSAKKDTKINKNNLINHTFIVKVDQPSSALVVMTEHPEYDSNSDLNVVIYGNEKSWILIEHLY